MRAAATAAGRRELRDAILNDGCLDACVLTSSVYLAEGTLLIRTSSHREDTFSTCEPPRARAPTPDARAHARGRDQTHNYGHLAELLSQESARSRLQKNRGAVRARH